MCRAQKYTVITAAQCDIRVGKPDVFFRRRTRRVRTPEHRVAGPR